jgi:hypothetical protein
MSDVVQGVDCCLHPDLESEKSFISSEDDAVSVQRCRHCGCRWFRHLHEYEIATPDYNRRTWWVRLNDEMAMQLLACSGPPCPSRFAECEGIVKDEDGFRRVRGVPPFLNGAV